MLDADVKREGLVLAAQGGDPAALAQLLAACQPDVRRYARRHCRVSDVDDAVQEALIVVSRKLPSLKAALAFSGWLLTVIKRQCSKLARAMLPSEPLEEDALDAAIAARTDGALRIDLARALESLPAHYLEVVLLRDVEELTIAEIGARLNEGPGAVKSRLHRARALVRDYLTSSR